MVANDFVKKLEELENNHPNSVYTPAALPILSAWYKIDLNNEQKADEVMSRWQGKYTLESGNLDIVKSTVFGIKDSSKRNEFIKELRTHIKGPLSDRMLKEAIKSKELR